MHWDLMEPVARARIDDLHKEARAARLIRESRDGTDGADAHVSAIRTLTARLTRPVRLLTVRKMG